MITIKLRKPGYVLLASVLFWILIIAGAMHLAGCSGSAGGNAARAAVGLPPSISTGQQVCPPNDSGTYPSCTACPTGAQATTSACVCPVGTTLNTSQNQCAASTSNAPPTTTSGSGSNSGDLGNAPPTTAPIAGAPACPTGGTPDPSTSECIYPPTAGTGSSSGSGTGTPTAPTPPASPVVTQAQQVWLAVPTVGVDQFTGAPTLSWQDSDLIAACTVTAPGNYSSGPYPADGGGYPYVLDPLPSFSIYTVTCVDPSGSTLTGTATVSP
jgi:hypothetical protein